MKKLKKKQGDVAANAMWGGHYARGPAEVMARINECLAVDKRLYEEDIIASVAQAEMLGKRGIISAKDAAALKKGLERVRKEIEGGKFQFKTELEDVHMNVEARLAELVGEAAGRLHTGRSRNDQVAVDLRLWIRGAIDRLDVGLKALQVALVEQADRHAGTLMPGFTHLQTAQPVTFGHHLLAYVEMFGRDRGRLIDARRRMNESPLGAAALAGTSHPIDSKMTAKALGFDRPMANSMDAVASRDYALEFLSALNIAGVHLSRLAEEIVIWSSDAFGFVKLSEAFTTGSSIMPQKRNPDAAELVRAKAGALFGALAQLTMLMKGLPLTYNKDLQESKPPVISAADEFEMMLAAMAGMVRDLTADEKAMRAATGRGFITATDLADALVRRFNVPFRKAHHITGKIVRLAEAQGCRLDELKLADMRRVEPRLDASIYDALKPEKAVMSRVSFGGTAPGLVRAEVKRWKKVLR